MTRKDYIAIARVLAYHRPLVNEDGEQAYQRWRELAQGIANALQIDNPRFDHERFREACHE